MKKTRVKITSLLLIFIMIATCFPTRIFSAQLTEKATAPSAGIPTDISAEGKKLSPDSDYTVLQSAEYIADEIIGEVKEVISLREENVKHFRLSDGTYEAVMYPTAVHRKDKNGKWQDIDNSLSSSTVNGISKYVTADKRLSFADKLTSGDRLFSMSENGYTISMSFINGNDVLTKSASADNISDRAVLSQASIKNPQKSEAVKANAFSSLEEAVRINNTGTVKYKNVLSNTDIEYVLKGNDVKENIIVRARSEAYEYRFKISLVGLTPKIDTGGNIVMNDTETGEPEYIIPAPYMYDDSGDISHDVWYKLDKLTESQYVITITAEAKWINADDRVFPVTIDPTIKQNYTVNDTYTSSLEPNRNHAMEDELWIDKYRTTYILFYIPTLPSAATINSAQMHLSYYCTASEGNVRVGIHEIDELWFDDEITYNNSPHFEQYFKEINFEASYSFNSDFPKRIAITLTDIVTYWHDNPKSNNGIALSRISGDDISVILPSYDARDDLYSPYLTINYSEEIPEGVYAFKNINYSNRWMTIKDNKLQHKYLTTSPADTNVFDRSCLFKVSKYKNTDRYVLRSMLNNNLTLDITKFGITTKEIPSADDDVSPNDTFHFVWDRNGYVIHSGWNVYVINLGSTSEADLSPVPQESATSAAQWKMVMYTGPGKHGTKYFFPKNIIEGESAWVTANIWSTYIRANEHYIRISDNNLDKASSIWLSEEKKLIIYPKDDGNLSLNIDIRSGSLTRNTLDISLTVQRNYDPLYKDNISFIRYTDITTNRTSHLLTVIGSSIGADDVFIVQNMKNNAIRSYQLSDSLINKLQNLENSYNAYFWPYIQSTTEEAAAHSSKLETDQLVDNGYISYGSSEYYGSWASNYDETLRIVNTLTQYVNTYTAIYSVYMAVTTFYYSYLYNNTYTVYSNQYCSTISNIDDISNQLTHNSESSKVMLGSNDGKITWYTEGQKQGMTYFYTPDWNSYISQYGDDMMKAANKQFLNTQKMAGKEFYFSHYPMDTIHYYPNSDFAMELNWLKDAYGLAELTEANFIKYGSYWKFVP